jgi:hypothetical protein
VEKVGKEGDDEKIDVVINRLPLTPFNLIL